MSAADATLHRVADVGSMNEGQRMHVCLNGRYVSLVRKNNVLTCIDSICFHAGGPLGIGDIEEVNGKQCLVCPWHTYKIDLATGEKYYQSVQFENGKMIPGPWKSNGPRQRIHHVEEKADGIYVQLNEEGSMASDEYAGDAACGERLIHGTGGQGSSNVGADGTWRQKSGQILRHLSKLAGKPS